MTLAQGLLTIPSKNERKSEIVSPSKEAYRKLLADTILQGRSRILSFSNQPPAPIQSFPNDPYSTQVQPIRKLRRIPQVLIIIYLAYVTRSKHLKLPLFLIGNRHGIYREGTTPLARF